MDKKTLLSLLPTLFDDIEKNKGPYGVDSCGLSYTTLEDVFLSVGSDIDLKAQNGLENNNKKTNGYGGVTNGNGGEDPVLLCSSQEMNSGGTLWVHQFLGLLLKRFHFARRYWPMVILQIVIPVIIILIAMFINSAVDSISKVTEASLTLDVKEIYGSKTETFFYGSQKLNSAYKDANVDRYSALFSPLGGETSNNTEISYKILAKSGSLQSYIQHHLYGAGESTDKDGRSFFENWANSEQTHSLPLSITVLFESLLRLVLPESLQKQASILVQSVPMLMASKQQETNMITIFVSWALTCLFFLPIAFPFLAASYILYPIKENVSKSKLIQLMTRLSPVTFWTASFLFDLLTHLIAITIILVVLLIFDTNGIITSNGSGVALFLLLFSFGISTIPVVYFLSYRFQKPSSGFVFLIIIFFLVGFIGNIVLSVMDTAVNYFDADSPAIKNFWMPFLLFFLRFVPIFSMLFGYQKVHKLAAFGKFCKDMPPGTCDSIYSNSSSSFKGCCPGVCGDMCYLSGNPFAMTKFGAGPEMLYMFCTGIFCFSMIVLGESRSFY